MRDVETYSLPHLEWEAITFPLEISGLTFDQPDLAFDALTTITIWRDTHLQLKARLTGRIRDPRSTDETAKIGKGNIVKSGTISGTDTGNNTITLKDSIFGAYQTHSYTYNELGHLLDMEVIFDTLKIEYLLKDPDIAAIEHHYEWFLTEDISPHFWGRTVRSLSIDPPKLRAGIDQLNEDELPMMGISMSKDHFLLEVADVRCIVSKVPDQYVPENMKGLCFEFRDQDIHKADRSLIRSLKHFLSFMLGGELYYIGHSRLRNHLLVEVLADSPEIPHKLGLSLPPIKYNERYDWGNFALQVNKLFPRYLDLQAKLSMNHAIDRFWIAGAVPISVNLPVLAGAVEIIAGEYLKMTGNDHLEYLPKKDYERLIGDEIKQIREKLYGIDGAEIMLNKITGAFRKGPNEKMTLFFNLLGLPIGKAEKEAINLRNKMTHGKRNYQIDDIAYDDIVHTRVYQVLFNRIILKLLGFEGYYIDYSENGSPLRPLNPVPAG